MSQRLGHKIQGISIGGMETCIELPHWKLAFDIGRCEKSAVKLPRVLFTHGHVDHMGGVVHHCATRDMLGLSPPQYFIPEENEEAFRAMIAAWRSLSRSELPCEIVAVKPGMTIDLGRNRLLSCFRSIHRVPTIGYALKSRKYRLRADLVGQPRETIIAAAHRGEEVNQPHDITEIAFCGDTTIDVVKREPLVREARVLVLEVTFLDDTVSPESARSMGHIHLDEVIEHADLFHNETLIFSHLSGRYTLAQAERILRERLPSSLKDRVILFERLVRDQRDDTK